MEVLTRVECVQICNLMQPTPVQVTILVKDVKLIDHDYDMNKYTCQYWLDNYCGKQTNKDTLK